MTARRAVRGSRARTESRLRSAHPRQCRRRGICQAERRSAPPGHCGRPTVPRRSAAAPSDRRFPARAGRKTSPGGSCSLARRADAHTTGAGRPRRARACTARRGTGRTAAGQTGDRAPPVPARPGKAWKEARKAACPATSASCDSPVWQTCFAAGFMRRRRGAPVGRIVRFATHW